MPLPSTTEIGSLDKDGLTIWTTLLEAEKVACLEADVELKYRDPLISIRVLGFLFLDLWAHANDWDLGNTPYTSLKDKIELCRRADDCYNSLVDLGLKCRNNIFQVFRSNQEHYSTPSPDDPYYRESKIPFNTIQQLMSAEIKNYQYSASKQALLRDGFKCSVTGYYDAHICHLMGGPMPNAPGYSDTKAAYIFPGGAQNSGEGSASSMVMDTILTNSQASFLPLLEIFGLQDLPQSLRTNFGNKLQNVITLESRLHTRFNNFELWLEPVSGQEHTYDVRIKKIVTLLGMPIPPRITLRVDSYAAIAAQKEGLNLALPDPLLMAIRAVCVRACNLSGATEHMELILRELEDTSVLSEDGGMAGLLASRLSMHLK